MPTEPVLIKTKTTKMYWYPEASGGTLTDERTDLDTSQGDHDRFKHYVWHPEKGRAAAMVTEAMVTGTPIRALCGKMWVPSRDPSRFPMCPECKELKEVAQNGGGGESE